MSSYSTLRIPHSQFSVNSTPTPALPGSAGRGSKYSSRIRNAAKPIGHCFVLVVLFLASFSLGCNRHPADEIVVYCGVDEPAASEVLAQFEQQTGLHVAPRYDIESSRSVGLSGKLEAERDNPRADVWWGSEAFLSARLAQEGILQPYIPPTASDVLAQYKDPDAYWTGIGLRARVLAVSVSPPFPITSLQDLADPRLKDKIAMSRPSSGATGAHLAALYVLWGPQKAQDYFRKLHANHIALLGGNAEVANAVGAGTYVAGLTDSDSIIAALANGGRLTQVVPDQNGDGTFAMPTTVALVKGAPHEQSAKKLIDFLASRQAEQKLLDMKYATWSVRDQSADAIKAFNVDYHAAARMYPQAQREATAILEGRE
jgi:iron(III) transport system substrate-binding protein